MILLPRFYAILDAACFSDEKDLFAAAENLAAAGCTLIQYRNKSGDARAMLEQARALKARADSHVSQRKRDMGHPQFRYGIY